MPYTITRAGGQFCVSKADADGNAIGEPLKCYDDQQDAAAYLGALEANVTDAEKMFGLLTQEEVGYVPLSAKRGLACANCRWFMPGDPDYCHLVECEPEPILPTGWCDRHETRPAPEEPEPITVVIVESEEEGGMDMGYEEMSHTHEGEEKRMVYIAPDHGGGILDKVARAMRGGLKPGTRILKDATGKRLMFIVASNGYKDREYQHVATKSIQDYVNSQWTGDNAAFIGENQHYFWHMKELEPLGQLSDLIFCDVWNGFLVELWREADNSFAKGFYDWIETRTDIEWGASIGAWGKYEGNVVKYLLKRETSTLPLFAAANLLTLSEVIEVAKSKRDMYFDDWMKTYANVDGASDLLRSGVDKLAEALNASGVIAKSAEDKPQTETPEAVQKMAGVVLEVVGEQNAQAGELETLRKDFATMRDQFTAQAELIEAQTKELEELTRAVNRGGRRADRDASTVVDNPEALKKAQDSQVEFDPIWGGLNVPKKTQG